MSRERQLAFDWSAGMIDCFRQVLTQEEQESLLAWEASPEFTCTSDWPGWQRYLGKRPSEQIRLVLRRRA